MVLLTKADIAVDGGAAARSLIRGRSASPIIEVVDGDVDVDVVLGLDRGQQPDLPMGVGHGSYMTSVLDIGSPTKAELEQLLAELPADVIRAKGVVQCSDQAAPVEAHVVGSRRSVRLRRDLTTEQALGQLVVITPT